MKALRLVRDDEPQDDALFPEIAPAAPAAPDLDAMYLRALASRDRALALGQMELHRQPRYPWDRVADLAPIFPWQWHIFAAASGNGKTTLALSMLHGFVQQGFPVYAAMLEQPVETVRRQWAAVATGHNPSRGIDLKLPAPALAALDDHVRWQLDDGYDLAYLDDAPFLRVEELERVWQEAKALERRVIVIDHLHRIRGQGDSYQKIELLAQTITELCKQYMIPAVCMAQLNRGDKHNLRNYTPPSEYEISGGEVLRQECSQAFGLYRPLLGKLSKADYEELRLGLKQIKECLEPHCVGLRVIKDRYGGSMGEILKLRYEDGRVLDPTAEQRRAWEERHGL